MRYLRCAPADSDTLNRQFLLGGFFSTGPAQLFYQQTDHGDITQTSPQNGFDPSKITQITIDGPEGPFHGAGLIGGNQFVVASAVPVPAAAWLFFSGIACLASARRVIPRWRASL